jgi:CMP-N,N'-diacetyllegionaminic acid synthase
MKPSIKALIAVRSGSERVKDKNIRPFADSSLLEIKVRQCLKIFDGVVVSSDDSRMLDLASSLGATAIKRDAAYCHSNTPMSEVYRHMARNFPGDIVAYCNATNPMIKDQTLSECKRLFQDFCSEGPVSVNTVADVKEFLWQDGTPLNYTPAAQPRSQDLPNIVRITFACSIISKLNMMLTGNVVGTVPMFVKTDDIESMDIDTQTDFQTSEIMYLRLRKAVRLL